MVICLELDADLHMPQWMPLPLTVSCFSKIQIGFTFLVPAHLGSPGKKAVKRVCVHLQWHLVTHLHRHRCFAHGLAGCSWSASYNISSRESLGTSGTVEQHTFQQQNSAEAQTGNHNIERNQENITIGLTISSSIAGFQENEHCSIHGGFMITVPSTVSYIPLKVCWLESLKHWTVISRTTSAAGITASVNSYSILAFWQNSEKLIRFT